MTPLPDHRARARTSEVIDSARSRSTASFWSLDWPADLSPGDVVSVVRRLVAAPDAQSAQRVVEAEPRVRQPPVVAMLADRRDRAAKRGRHELAERIDGRIAVLVGSPDRQLVDAVVTLARADRRLPLVDRDIQAVEVALTVLFTHRGRFAVDFGWWPELWSVVASVADRLADMGAGREWYGYAVLSSRKAVAETETGTDAEPRRLDALSYRLARQHGRLGERNAIHEAVEVARRAVAVTRPADDMLPARLNNLADRLGDLAHHDRDPSRLAEVIEIARRSVEFCPDERPEKPALLDCLADHLIGAIMAGGSPVLLDEALEASKRSVALTPPGDVDLASRLYALSVGLGSKYAMSANPEALAEALVMARRSVEVGHPAEPNHQSHLANLASRLADLMLLVGDPATLAELHGAARRVLAASPADNAGRLDDLADRLGQVAERTADQTTADLAAAIGKASIAATPVQSPALVDRLIELTAQVVKLNRLRGDVDSKLDDAGWNPNAQDWSAAPVRPSDRRSGAMMPDPAGAADDGPGSHSLHPGGPTADRVPAVEALPPAELAPALAEAENVAAAESEAIVRPVAVADIGQRSSAPEPATSTEPIQLRSNDDLTQYSNGPVAMLQIHIWLLFLIPSGLRIGVLGALGQPATIWGFGLFFLWLVAELTPGNDTGRPCPPLRIALAAFWVVVMISYGLLHQFDVPLDQKSNADRFIIGLFAFSGVALVAGEGLRTKVQQLRVLRTLASAVAVMCLIAVAQSRLGLDYAQLVARLPGLSSYNPLESVLARSGLNRPSGTAAHPIEFGVVVGATLAIAIHLVLYDRSWSRRYRLPMFGLIAIGVPVAVSRSALLVSLIVVVFFFLDAEPRLRVRALGVLLTIMVVVFLTVPGLLGTLADYVTVGSADSSIATRTSDYAAVAPYLRESPFIGHGPGTFLPRLRILDNQYLLTLIETGIVGLITLIGMLSLPAVLGSASRVTFRERDDRQLGRMYVGVGVGFLASAATFDALSFPMFTAIIAFMMGMSSSHWSRSRDVRTSAAVECRQ